MAPNMSSLPSQVLQAAISISDMMRNIGQHQSVAKKQLMQAPQPFNPITLRFLSGSQESQFQQQWTIRRSIYDRNALAVSLSCMMFASVLQLVLALRNSKMGVGDEESCPAVTITSLIGGGSHLVLLLLMGSSYIRHRTAIVTFFRMYSALTTAAFLPGCAVASLTANADKPAENFLSSMMLYTAQGS